MSWLLLPISKFRDFEPGWGFLHNALGRTPLLDPLFVQPLIDIFSKGNERLALYGDVERPLAVAILSKRNAFSWQTFQPANAPLGAWMKQREAQLEGLLRQLTRSLPRPTLVIGLSQLDPDIFPRPAHAKHLGTLNYIRTARIKFHGTYDAYWSARGKNLRHNMKRQRNWLARVKIRTRLDVARKPDKMGVAVSDYARLESAGWKGVAASAVRAEEAQGQFYTTMLQGFARQNEALVYRYFFDDELVASDICLLRDKILIILKTAHDESKKGISPAHLMRHEIIQDAFQSGEISQIEFYGPARDWHLKWTDDVRTMYHVNYYRSGFISRLHAQTNPTGGSRD